MDADLDGRDEVPLPGARSSLRCGAAGRRAEAPDGVRGRIRVLPVVLPRREVGRLHDLGRRRARDGAHRPGLGGREPFPHAFARPVRRAAVLYRRSVGRLSEDGGRVHPVRDRLDRAGTLRRPGPGRRAAAAQPVRIRPAVLCRRGRPRLLFGRRGRDRSRLQERRSPGPR